MTEHITPVFHSSLVGGSTASRRIGCPRSYSLEQQVPEDNRGSVYAQEGTALHEVMALALEKDIEPTTLIPFTFTSKHEGWSFTVDHDLWLDKGEPALKAFDAFVAEHEDRIGQPMRFLIETRVEFPGIPGAFGTSDIIGRCGPEIAVIDWKFGRGIVPATENKQLMFYAAGALNSARNFFDGMLLGPDTLITMAIIQPMREGGIDTWTTNLARLDRYGHELRAAVEAIQTLGLDAPIQDGPWCTFARCKSICPLHLGAAAKLSAKFADLQARTQTPPVACDENGNPIATCGVCGKSWNIYHDDEYCDCPPRPNDMAERYADLLDLVDMVEDWAKEVREQAHAAAERGMPIPGWVLEPGRKGPRKWAIDDAEVVKTFASEEYGLTEDDVAPRKPLTLPALEKILKRLDKAIPEGFTSQSEPTNTRLVRSENATEVVTPTPAKAVALAEKLLRL
jgi:hypothetical protein